MERYPENTQAGMDDFRRSDWKSAVATSEPRDYGGLWKGLSAAARAAIGAGRLPEGKILWLLADACSLRLKPASFNEPFTPQIVAPNGRTAGPDDFKESDVELMARISDEVDDPWLRGRLADLAWLLRIPKEPKYALAAIDA